MIGLGPFLTNAIWWHLKRVAEIVGKNGNIANCGGTSRLHLKLCESKYYEAVSWWSRIERWSRSPPGANKQPHRRRFNFLDPLFEVEYSVHKSPVLPPLIPLLARFDRVQRKSQGLCNLVKFQAYYHAHGPHMSSMPILLPYSLYTTSATFLQFLFAESKCFGRFTRSKSLSNLYPYPQGFPRCIGMWDPP